MKVNITLSYPKYPQDKQFICHHYKYSFKMDIDDALIEKYCSDFEGIQIRKLGYDRLVEIMSEHYPEEIIPEFENVFLYDFEF